MSTSRRPSLAVLVALLTLALVVGAGGAWAGAKITSKDIAAKAIRAKHVKKNQIKTVHLRRDAVTANKLDQGATYWGRARADRNEALILKVPEMNLEVRTFRADTDNGHQVRIYNRNPADGVNFNVATSKSTTTVPANASRAVGTIGGFSARIVENGGVGQMLRLDCLSNVIGAGDDQFAQCMATTAGPR